MDRLTNNVTFLVALLPIVVIVGIIIFNLMILQWIYRDAKARGDTGATRVLITLISGFIGLAVWLMVRPPKIDPEKRRFTPDEFADLAEDEFAGLDN